MRGAFTRRELDVMTVLWDQESATVSEVRSKLKDKLAYTTVLTVLRILEQKGYVKHEEDGRAHRYVPLVKRESAGTSALKRLVDTVFKGSPELLMTQLVSEHDLSQAEIKRLRKLLEERLREAKP
ncbi:MAG TPA: BlaI/MecI/CopY family transcriptional regulator [Gemmatimonadales bacterium]|nr:BlaI/MecI/CopY family transcriptional regulator [Gemmatimonadales bacterium]